MALIQTSRLVNAVAKAKLPPIGSKLIRIAKSLVNPLSTVPAPDVYWRDPRGKKMLVVTASGASRSRWVPVTQGDVLERLLYELIDAMNAQKGATPEKITPALTEIIRALSVVWDHPRMSFLKEQFFYDWMVREAVVHRLKKENPFTEDAVVTLLPEIVP